MAIKCAELTDRWEIVTNDCSNLFNSQMLCKISKNGILNMLKLHDKNTLHSLHC